jgi:hypothetical protein
MQVTTIGLDIAKNVFQVSNSHFGWERGLSKGATD